MNEMIERAANKLSDDIANFKATHKPGDVFTAQDMVRSVVKAIREPTEAMIKAGNKHTDWADGADEAWKSMVDEILKEPAKRTKCECGKPDLQSCYNPDCSRSA